MHKTEPPSASPDLVKPVLKFAMTGGVATLVDISLYLLLVTWFLGPVTANVISYGLAMCLNFFLQRTFVFKLNRSLIDAFRLSMLVSLGGMAFSTGIVFGLNQVEGLTDHQWLVKLVATGVVFVYNFFFKRYAFERRFL